MNIVCTPWRTCARGVALTLTTLVLGCGDSGGGETSGTDTNNTTVQTTGTSADTNPTDTTPETGTSTGEPTTEPTSTPTTSTSTGTDSTQGDDSTAGTTVEDTSTSNVDETGTPVTTAKTMLEAKSGSMVSGNAVFTDIGGGMVELVVTVQNVTPPGLHGLHIHQNPDCSAPDASSAGDHWNPPGTMLGELGNIEIAADGTGVFEKTEMWSIGTGEVNDVVAHSIVIHAEENMGARLACGVISQD